MAVQQLNFQGINRTITDYSSTTACEELINLRPTGTGLVPVKPFSVKMDNITYGKVFVHKAASETNYIALKKEGDDVNIYQISESGSIIGESEIDSFSIENAPNFSFDNIYFSTVGNIMLFSIADKDDSFFLNLSYIWSNGKYKEQEANIPQIEADFTKTDLSVVQYDDGQAVWDSGGQMASRSQLAEYFKAVQNALESNNKSLCFGPILIAIAFKTKDGNTFWTNHWYLVNPIPEFKTSELYIPPEDIPAEERPTYPEGVFKFYNEVVSQYQTSHYYSAVGVKVNMIISGISSSLWNEETSLIESVEVYSTRPVFYVSAEDSLLYFYVDPTSAKHIALSPQSVKDMDLEKNLLFLQKSIPIRDLIGRDSLNPYTFSFEFGGNIQVTNKTLEVDSGAVTRYGDNLSYNARFHFFDSIKKTDIGGIEFYFDNSSTDYTTDIFIKYSDGDEDGILYLGSVTLPHNIGGAYYVIAPSIHVKEIITVDTSSGNNYIRRYHMDDSERYNYTFCVDKAFQVGQGYPSELYAVKTEQGGEGKSFIITDEPNAINVTEQYNPFVFRVEHSYLAPGKVLDLQPQMVAVKDVTFGDYPLNVFTDRGVYALLQGSGTTLYGNFRAISNLITTSNSIPTEMGTFLVAAGGLWLIAGDNAVLVSEALSLGPHKFIRGGSGYQAISAQAGDVSKLLSDPIFEKYVEGATLSYNRYRDELFVSNPDYDYCYVLSLKYRQWFKMSLAIFQDVVGSGIAAVLLPNGFKNIVDFSNESEDTSVLVHLQSRPFSFSGYMYTHIHRVVSMVRAALSNTDILVVSLYGSDDLQEWVLLSYAGQSSKSAETPLRISQLRTPPAARSWRYYTICIGGTIPTDTDLGPDMIEYQPVIRRLG